MRHVPGHGHTEQGEGARYPVDPGEAHKPVNPGEGWWLLPLILTGPFDRGGGILAILLIPGEAPVSVAEPIDPRGGLAWPVDPW